VADVSVRPARAEDVPEIARIQVETWRTAYARLLPAEVLETVTVERAAAAWSAAVSAPPSGRHRVLVAQEQHWLVGFVAFGPAEPDETGPDETGPDETGPGGPGRAEPGGSAREPSAGVGRTARIAAMLVEPRWGRRGHGSRLLAATVDLLREDGMTAALVWVPESDRASTDFYASAGWERDGLVRTLQTDGHMVREVRFHVSLEEEQ
jgi:GNAT superfamily N-acetyltransferase